MAYMGQAAAYERDYEYTKPSKPGITVLPENNNVKRSVAKKAPYVKYFAMVVCVFATLLCILSSYSKVTELTAQTDNMKTEITKLKGDANALNAKKEQRFNLEYVEQVAVNTLGMVKLDKNQITYVTISNPEKITIAAEEDKSSAIVSGIVKSFNAVVEYLN
ncbi:MAG: hypothetical protein VB078_01070 [Clostridiaceae bacterium]|nr:hypothetical protein [Clostridiaceae bacterium]